MSCSARANARADGASKREVASHRALLERSHSEHALRTLALTPRLGLRLRVVLCVHLRIWPLPARVADDLVIFF